MLTSVHLFVGAAIGEATGNVWVTIPVALISHYLIDTIPHYNPKPVKSYREKGLGGADKKDLLLKALEPLIGIGLLAFLIYMKDHLAVVMIIGAFFGWLPDLAIFLEWKYNIKCRPAFIRQFETAFHPHTSFVVGSIPQVIILVVATFFILQ